MKQAVAPRKPVARFNNHYFSDKTNFHDNINPLQRLLTGGNQRTIENHEAGRFHTKRISSGRYLRGHAAISSRDALGHFGGGLWIYNANCRAFQYGTGSVGDICLNAATSRSRLCRGSRYRSGAERRNMHQSLQRAEIHCALEYGSPGLIGREPTANSALRRRDKLSCLISR